MPEILKSFYGYLHDRFGGDEIALSVIGGAWCVIGWFWLVSALFLYADFTGYPIWLRKYKIQEGKNEPLDFGKLKQIMPLVLFNNFVLNLAAGYPMYLGQKLAGCTFSVDETPHIWRIVVDLIGSIIVQEIIFYYSHRLLHCSFLYKYVHKLHHRWTAPIAPVAIYAHPIEYLTGNGLSIYIGPLLMQSHMVTIWIWYTLATVGTLIHHSGYHLPLTTSSEAHDYHHMTFNYNYGTLGILDWIHGTDIQFLKSINSKRHRTLISFASARELYPEASTKME